MDTKWFDEAFIIRRVCTYSLAMSQLIQTLLINDERQFEKPSNAFQYMTTSHLSTNCTLGIMPLFWKHTGNLNSFPADWFYFMIIVLVFLSITRIHVKAPQNTFISNSIHVTCLPIDTKEQHIEAEHVKLVWHWKNGFSFRKKFHATWHRINFWLNLNMT